MVKTVSAAQLSCPIPVVMASEGISPQTMVSLMKTEWRFLVLNLVAYHRHIHYNSIKEESGLSSKTLSIVLKELKDEGLIAKEATGKGFFRSEYVVTEAGRGIVMTRCPLLSMVATAEQKQRK